MRSFWTRLEPDEETFPASILRELFVNHGAIIAARKGRAVNKTVVATALVRFALDDQSPHATLLTFGQETESIAMKSLTTVAIMAVFIMLALTSCTKRKMVQKSSTMEPTIRSGETIDVDFGAFAAKGPSRWEAIVFEAPSGGGQWCSRVVGLPGETIDITSTGLTVDGRKVSGRSGFSMPSYRPVDHPPSSTPTVTLPFRVPAGSYFVLGDNVGNSLDSRYWGGLDESKIIGRIVGK